MTMAVRRRAQERRGYRRAVALMLLIALAAAGGASRADESLQTVVRLVAVVAIAATLWPLELEPLRRNRVPVLGAFAALALVLVQLVPLPPALWAALPGHAVYADIARATGTVGWRPLSLTPDLTRNALFALLPPMAAGLAFVYLRRRDRARVVEAVVFVACISAVLGLVQIAADGTGFRLYRLTSDGAPVGLFANRNHQAVLLACALPLLAAAAGARLRRGGDDRLLWTSVAVAALLLLLAIGLTGSRMGLAVGMIGLAGAGWSLDGAGIPSRRLRHRRIAAALAVGGVLALALLAAGVRSGAIERLIGADPVADTRIAMLPPLLRTAAAFMPLGAGFGAFDGVYRRFEPDALLSTIYMNEAHNEPVQLAIEGGVPALVLLGLFGWWWVARARRVIAIPRSPRRASGIAMMTVGAILMMSSLVDYPLRTPLLGALFVVACLMLDRAARNEEHGAARAGAVPA